MPQMSGVDHNIQQTGKPRVPEKRFQKNPLIYATLDLYLIEI